MKVSIVFLLLSVLLEVGCSKKDTASDSSTPIAVTGHLRYSCNCYDGPGLYYVIEPAQIEKSLATGAVADSILLLGDGHGSWQPNMVSCLENYVDKRTVLSGELTELKGCLQTMIAGPCNGTLPVVNLNSLTIIPD